MSALLNSVQDTLLQQRRQKLKNLRYQDLRSYTKPAAMTFDYFAINMPPPNESSTTKNELHEVLELSNSRTNKDILDILYVDIDPLYLYTEFLHQKQLSFSLGLFSKMYGVLYPVVKELKLFFNRPRPNQIAEFYNIDIPVINTKTHQTASYPSGHVAYAKLAEMIATEEFPQYIDQFKSFTNKVGLCRMQQGVHFSSDNEAAIQLVHKIFDQLKKEIS